jgi:glutamate 5-kinase
MKIFKTKNFSQIKLKSFKMRREKVVIKIGSSVLANELEPDNEIFYKIAKSIYEVKVTSESELKIKLDVVIVSSGAMLFGIFELGKRNIPKLMKEKQALCAVGQPKLMSMWSEAFSNFNIKTAQILLTHEDFSSKSRSQNIKNTVEELLKIGVIPIANENDTVATEEIRLGDNDFLSVYLAALIEAQKLIIASDIKGIIDRKGNIIEEINFEENIWEKIEVFDTGKKVFAGGISSKLSAVKLASEFGITSFILDGKNPETIKLAIEGKNPGTKILPKKKGEKRKIWIANIMKGKGQIQIDRGAYEAIKKGKSLLPSGIKSVSGEFSRGDMVEIVVDGKVIARGITNYSSAEINLIKGKKTSEIAKILGSKKEDEVIHQDNMLILESEM